MMFIKKDKEKYYKNKCHYCERVIYTTLSDFSTNKNCIMKVDCPKCNNNLYFNEFCRITKHRYFKELEKIDKIDLEVFNK